MVILIHPFFLQGGDSASVIAAGLPNITGQACSVDGGTNNFAGAFYYGGIGTNKITSNVVWGSSGFKFDASRVSSVYGASDTVQPNSLLLVPQIKF